MKNPMDIIDIFQEYVLRSKATSEDANGVQKGSVRRCNGSCSNCCGSGGAASMRDCSTGTYDLSSYVWHTEGEGMAEQPGMGNGVGADEGQSCSCPTSTSGGRKQCSVRVRTDSSKRRKTEAQSSTCDMSTSTFDLIAYVWGIEGGMHMTGPAADEEMEERSSASLDHFSSDLGHIDNAGRSLGEGGGMKRSRVSAAIGHGVISKLGEIALLPQKKKRRILIQEEERREINIAWRSKMR